MIGLNRRTFIAGAAMNALPARANAQRKNVILIVSDDQMFDTLAFAMPKTKARASLTWFKNGVCQSVVCEPSRAGIFKGQNDKRTGVVNNPDDRYFNEQDTLATWLHGAGYRTGLFGKYFNAYPFGRGNYTPPGWDDWHAHIGGEGFLEWNIKTIENGVQMSYPKLGGNGQIIADNYGTRIFAAKTVAFINDSVAKGVPFFAYFAPDSPHDPASVEPQYALNFKNTVMPRNAAFNNVPVNGPAWLNSLSPFNPVQMDHDRRTQWRATLSIDDAVDGIFNALEQNGILENTIVIFTTDQGRALGEHRWKSKRTLYEETSQVPLFTYGLPNVTGSEVISLVDIAPTICAAVGVKPTIQQDGVPIGQRTAAYIHWIGGAAGGKYTGAWQSPAFDAVRTAQFKYAELPKSPMSPGEAELYDLLVDPCEMNNVANNPGYLNIRKNLATQLTQFRGY